MSISTTDEPIIEGPIIDGWERFSTDEAPIQYYYFHEKTDTTTWEYSETLIDVPQGWAAYSDSDDNTYYVHEATNVTVWTLIEAKEWSSNEKEKERNVVPSPVTVASSPKTTKTTETSPSPPSSPTSPLSIPTPEHLKLLPPSNSNSNSNSNSYTVSIPLAPKSNPAPTRIGQRLRRLSHKIKQKTGQSLAEFNNKSSPLPIPTPELKLPPSSNNNSNSDSIFMKNPPPAPGNLNILPPPSRETYPLFLNRQETIDTDTTPIPPPKTPKLPSKNMVSFRDDNDIDHLSKEDNTPPKRTSNIPTQSPISKPRKSHHRKSKTTSSITSTIFGKIATSNRIGQRLRRLSQKRQKGIHIPSLDEFNNKPLRILVVSWNVGNKEPNEKELEKLVCPWRFPNTTNTTNTTDTTDNADNNNNEATTEPPDMIVVGTQECKYHQEKGTLDAKELHEKVHEMQGINDKNGAMDVGHSHWVNILASVVGDRYHIVSKEHLLEMRLVVFATASVLNKVTGMSHKHKATGIAHVYGNKGGLVSSIKFGGTILSFVSCHLAAHSKHLNRRHSDVVGKFKYIY